MLGLSCLLLFHSRERHKESSPSWARFPFVIGESVACFLHEVKNLIRWMNVEVGYSLSNATNDKDSSANACASSTFDPICLLLLVGKSKMYGLDT